MKPTLAADTLQKTLTQYLTTTFGLSEVGVRDGLEGFLSHPEQGIFRGPYLRIRTPFREQLSRVVDQRLRVRLAGVGAVNDVSGLDEVCAVAGHRDAGGPDRVELVDRAAVNLDTDQVKVDSDGLVDAVEMGVESGRAL
ncbi:MAG: hypothetical protein AUG44_14010 [Actinobacteria bacterium 13_1_20CM_3_71_11]|nr:MAG: hypothetical protein AUG44_14010 [Actinobacteria bacterium 13_1_20CM_3_71_11]